MAQSLVKHYTEVRRELTRWMKGEYPSFVLSQKKKENQDICPVFVFHQVKAFDFEAMLTYLYSNGYKTVTMDQYIQWKSGKLNLTAKDVLLTFDDARASQWTLAEPLLAKFGYHGVLFAVSDFMEDGTLRAQWKEGDDLPAIQGHEAWDHSSQPLMSKQEILEMNRRGTMEIQSHSSKHSRVFIGPEIIDFWRPELSSAEKIDYELPRLISEGHEVGMRDQLWGTPIYRHAPKFSGLRRYLDSESVRKVATTYVELHGGPAFFKRKGWKQELLGIVETVSKEHAGSWGTDAAQHRNILEDLMMSKSSLEHLLKKEVKHLCLPWGSGCQLVVDLAKKAGFESISWTSQAQLTEDQGLFHIPRLKNDLLWRLPGTGRWPIRKVFWQRFLKRFRGEMDY